MAFQRKFLDRGEEARVKEIDASVREKWTWKWIEKSVDGRVASECIRKIEEPGKAFCTWCNKEVKYANGGWSMIKQHMGSRCHKEKIDLRKTNYKLSGKHKYI